MQYNSVHSARVLNLDKHFKDLSEQETFFLLNHTSLLSINKLNGSNSGKGKPLQANYEACDIAQPAGEVYTIGGYRSPLTKEVYSWHYNSHGVNYVLRTSNDGCDIVYYNNTDICIDLSAEPRHSIENFRAFLAIEKICANRDGKQLIWVNGVGDIHQIDVEASIATNNFTSSFFDRCPHPCAYTRMCVPDPCECLIAEWMPMQVSDLNLSNRMLDMPFQFIYKHLYYDGRESEWSDPSTTYFQNAKVCGNISGFSRCIKLRIPVGNPLVDRIKVGISNGQDIWYQVDIVEKYKKYNNAQEKWYQRELSDDIEGYDDIDCSFDYIFCNDKQKLQIDPLEISRVFNPIPRDVQGLINIKDALGFYNYIQGNCPFDKKEIQKFKVGLDCTQGTVCNPEFATITARILIMNRTNNYAGYVFREGAVPNAPDDITKAAYWGSDSHQISDAYGQKFNDPTRNFIVYVEATDFWGQAKQWKAHNGFVNKEETDIVVLPLQTVNAIPPDTGSYSTVHRYAVQLMLKGDYYYQEVKIKVPKGEKGFLRMPSHLAVNGIGDSQDTSTSVIGTLDIRNFRNGSNADSITNFKKREIYFDTCAGDIELNEAFYVRDNTVDAANGSAYSGYITDEGGNPAEGVDISYQSGGGATLATTDHNGFFSFHKSGASNADIYVRTEQDCSGTFLNAKTLTLYGTDQTMLRQDMTITEGNYELDFFAKVKVLVKNCNNVPVSGVRVALSGSKWTTTDANGFANFRVRNYITRDRTVMAIVMNNNGCYTKDCNNQCNPCMPFSVKALPTCFSATPVVPMGDMVIDATSALEEPAGLKSGGRYEYAVRVKGDCGRATAAYPTNFLDIPTTQEKGYFGFCRHTFSAPDMDLPLWGKCLQILRSENLNNYELQWKVDKIERRDGKIIITFQSLNDYNKQYAFKTNTTYQWIKGDRVVFIYNGDGTIFRTSLTGGILSYLALSPFHDQIISGETDAPADFFNQLLIQDDGRLDGLKEGAIFETQRQVAISAQQVYHSICADIPIENGRLVQSAGTFSTFDTFFVNRVVSGQTGSFVGLFEHHSPSDFWGERVSDAGKRYVANRFENERRFGRNIAISSPLVGNFFDSALVKKFEAPEQGDIIAMYIVDGKIILAICENDNFLAQSADELVRVGGDGIIRALPPDTIISDAQPKPYGQYGCQYDDVGSIYFGDGFATYVDTNKKAHIKHDYNGATNVATNRMESFFRIKCQQKEMNNANTTDPLSKFRWATGMNYQTGEVYLTLKRLRDPSINNSQKHYVVNNETIIYHPILDAYLGSASFTPEFYSQVDLQDDRGCAFIAFSKGKPFIHPILTDKFNEFFGITCDEVVGVVINKFPEKQKIGQAMEIQSEMKWFASEITTDNPNFISEIPPVKWKREKGKWNADFLYNKNSRAGLHGNSKDSIEQPTRGGFVAITLVRDNTDDSKYGTIVPAKRTLYNELDLVFTKFSLVEQTGFTSNL